MARMEIGSSSEQDALLSPRDMIIQRLSQMGVPSNYLDRNQPGLLAFMLENPTILSEVILTILPADSKADSDKDLESVSEDIFFESLQWLQWLMFIDEPQAALKQLAEKDIGQRAVCGAVWGQDELAYHCQTCAYDQTCAICVPCFQNGNHKDHDYSIIYTSGGCCDCGDITAWKHEGFCSKHVGTQVQSLSEEAADSIGPVVDALLLYWKNKLLSVEGNAEKHATEDDRTDIQKLVSNTFSSVMVDMLLNFCRCSESLLCFVSRRISQSKGLLDLLVKAEQFLSKTVVKKLHELLLKSLGEPTFKYEFAKKFIQYYPHIIERAVKSRKDTVTELCHFLPTFSVQIFTVPTLTPRLVREENLVGVLLECLGNIFYSCVGDKHLEVDKLHKLRKPLIHMIEDIRYSLNHADVQRYTAIEHPDVFRTWLRLMLIVQGMNPQKRVTGIHIEEENVHLLLPFLLEHYLRNIHNLLVEGAFSVTEVNRLSCLSLAEPSDHHWHATMGRISQEGPFCCLSNRENAIGFSLKFAEENVSVGSQIIPSSVIWLISECLQVIENCLESEIKASLKDNSHLECNLLDFPKKLIQSDSGKSLSLSPQGIDELQSYANLDPLGLSNLVCWPEIVYDVSSQEISFHIPLHRCLSLLLHRAMKTCYSEIGASAFASIGNVTGHPFLGHDFFSQAFGKHNPCGFSAFLMEAPLRLRVFCAQVHAGMWRRNADAGTSITQQYRAVDWLEGSVEVDLFLLQCCAAIAPPELFVARIQERFGLSDYLSLNLAQLNEYEAVLMQEMLTLLIQIVQERRFCGMSLEDNLQRVVVNKLAVGDATHSQLLEALPHDLKKNKEVQEVIHRVAAYMEPSSMKQGMYSLRNSYWKELDLYHPCWNSRDLQVAEERYVKICKVSPLDVQLPRWTKIFGPLSTIARLATSKSILQIVQAVLYYAVFSKKPSACRAPDEVLVKALHLLSLALDICEKHRNADFNRYNDSIDMTSSDKVFLSRVPSPAESKIPVLEFATEPTCMGMHQDSGNGKHESLISLLVTLMRKHNKENSCGDSRLSNIPSLVEGILKKFSQLNGACMNELKTLAPDLVIQMPEFSSCGSMPNMMQHSNTDESQKAKSRKHQAAIMEKMRAEQFKFVASFNVAEKDDLDTPTFTEEVQENLAPICSLCHDSDSESPLSFLVLVQKSKLSSLATRSLPTWEEVDNMDIDSKDDSINMVIDVPSSLGFLRDLHQNEFDTTPSLVTNHLPHKSHIQFPYLFNTEGNILPSTEMMERNIYLSVLEYISNHKFQFDAFASGLIPMLSLGTKCSRNGKDTESCNSIHHVESLLREVPNNNASSESSQCYGDASFISKIPALTGCDGIHISSCGHVMHQECHERYLSYLKQRYHRRLGFEGWHIVDPNLGELLCPVCRRFANSILPTSPNIFISNDTWKPKISPGNSTVLTACSSSLESDRKCSHLRHALSLLQGMEEVLKHGKYSLRNCLRAFPTKRNETIELASQPILRKLFEMYFLHENSILEPRKPNGSLMLWDMLKYSLISTEIAARGRDDTFPEDSNSCIQTLYKKLHSSNERILIELLQVVHAMKNLSHSQLLLRFGGFQHFVNSIIAGGIREGDMSSIDSKEDSLLSILEQVEKQERFPCIQFWKFAADPVLACDPFVSLMWIIFSLPLPFMLSTKSFLSFVHLFYIVCVVQALITCQKEQLFDKVSTDDSGLYDICKTVGVSSPAGKYFVSNHIDNSCTLNNMIRKFTFPYLRRCALLSMLLKSLSSESFDNHDGLTLDMVNIASCSTENLQADIRGIIELENMFQICSLDIVFNSKLVQCLALKWCDHFLRAYEAHKPENVLYSTTAVPFQLIKLPQIYQNLLERYIKVKCLYCGNVPEKPALCLLCGKLCSSWRLCCSVSGCEIHSTKCGAGIGIFLLVKETTILLQRSARQAFWPSLYLDAFGEEDHGMVRGRPLYLSNERYLILTDLVASHGLDHNSSFWTRNHGIIEF